MDHVPRPVSRVLTCVDERQHFNTVEEYRVEHTVWNRVNRARRTRGRTA
jgi:hypothetical protein